MTTPTHPNGEANTTPINAIRQAIRTLQPIDGYLCDIASRLYWMRDLFPPRGELTEEFRELVTTLSHLERAYRDADEALLNAYTEIEHAARIPNPLPLARQLNGHT